MSSHPIQIPINTKPPSLPQQKLRLRKGSVSAPDPFGSFSSSKSPQNVFSKLTIVRVSSSDSVDDGIAQRRRSLGHSRPGSLSSHTSSSPNSPSRVSFAASSFASRSPTRSRDEGSHHRADSLQHRRSNSFGPRLNPDEICDLARASCNPRSDNFGIPPPSLTSFSELPDNIYLPFLDRPSEVAALISEPNNAKLLKLLESSLNQRLDSQQPQTVDADPSNWTFSQLEHWLTHVDRTEADDYVWVRKMRDAIHPHSELIWQRLKEVLGVPLDFDADDEDDEDSPFVPTPMPRSPEVGIAPQSPSPTLESSLDIEAIRAKPPSPGDALREIKEDEPTDIGDAVDALYGLRISIPASDVPMQLSKPLSLQNAQEHTSTYDALEERGPGNPLFPSNFARVAIAPTLPANKRSSRSRSSSQTEFYPSFMRPGRSGYNISEYAVTTGSSSSVYSVAT